jgi:hypothetical protein
MGDGPADSAQLSTWPSLRPSLLLLVGLDNVELVEWPGRGTPGHPTSSSLVDRSDMSRPMQAADTVLGMAGHGCMVRLLP